jgi:hypothetical protein
MTMEELSKKIEEIEKVIEGVTNILGFEKGYDLLITLYSNLAELRKQQNIILLRQTGNDSVTLGRWEHRGVYT